MKQPPPQTIQTRGGTLLGFVGGLLLGLGVALVVAIYITGAPLPFVDRGLAGNPQIDAKEAQHNLGWNPNAGIAPAPPPLPAPTVSLPSATTASTTSTAAVTTTATSAPPSTASPTTSLAHTKTPTAATDPLGDLAQSRSTKSPATAGAYFVQAGAFVTAEEAQSQKAKLAILGIDSHISEREQSGRMIFRVRVGPFSQQAPAQATQEQLQANGIEAALVSAPR